MSSGMRSVPDLKNITVLQSVASTGVRRRSL